MDAEGPLVRLKNLLFNQRTLLTIAQWVTVGSNKCPYHPVHLFTLTDLLVRSLTYGHWIRHHHGSLYQVFCCSYSLKVRPRLLRWNAFKILFFVSVTPSYQRINTLEKPWGGQSALLDEKWVTVLSTQYWLVILILLLCYCLVCVM